MPYLGTPTHKLKFRWLDEIENFPGLTDSAFPAALALVSFMNAQGVSCSPSRWQIVQRSGLSLPAVYEAADCLREVGLLEIEKRPNRSNLYRIPSWLLARWQSARHS